MVTVETQNKTTGSDFFKIARRCYMTYPGPRGIGAESIKVAPRSVEMIQLGVDLERRPHVKRYLVPDDHVAYLV